MRNINIPANEADLKAKFESYDIKEVEEQRNEIRESTSDKIKEAHRDTMMYILWGYIFEHGVDISTIRTSGTTVELSSSNSIDTKIDDISTDDIERWLTEYFVVKGYEKKNGKEISKHVAEKFKSDFRSEQDIKQEKIKFDANIEQFRDYLKLKDSSNNTIYDLLTEDELVSMWQAVQINLVQKWVKAIEEKEWFMQTLLGQFDIEWLNGKSLKENWENANWLQKWLGMIGLGYWLYKGIMLLWDKSPLKWHFWKVIWGTLAADLAWQVYSWESYLKKWLVWTIELLVWSNNIEDYKKQQKELEAERYDFEEEDYAPLALLVLWERSGRDLDNFGFINKSSNDPMVQMLVLEAEKNWDSIADLKRKLTKGRGQLIENTTNNLPEVNKLTLNELKSVSWNNLFEKRDTVMTRIDAINRGIDVAIDNWLVRSDIIKDYNNQIKDFLINGTSFKIKEMWKTITIS